MFAKLRAKIEAFESLHGGKNLDARRMHNLALSQAKLIQGGGRVGEPTEQDATEAHFVAKHLMSFICRKLQEIGTIDTYKHLILSLMMYAVRVGIAKEVPDDVILAFVEYVSMYIDQLGYFDHEGYLFESPMGKAVEVAYHDLLEEVTTRNMTNTNLQKKVETFWGGGRRRRSAYEADHAVQLDGAPLPKMGRGKFRTVAEAEAAARAARAAHPPAHPAQAAHPPAHPAQLEESSGEDNDSPVLNHAASPENRAAPPENQLVQVAGPQGSQSAVGVRDGLVGRSPSAQPARARSPSAYSGQGVGIQVDPLASTAQLATSASQQTVPYEVDVPASASEPTHHMCTGCLNGFFSMTRSGASKAGCACTKVLHLLASNCTGYVAVLGIAVLSGYLTTDVGTKMHTVDWTALLPFMADEFKDSAWDAAISPEEQVHIDALDPSPAHVSHMAGRDIYTPTRAAILVWYENMGKFHDVEYWAQLVRLKIPSFDMTTLEGWQNAGTAIGAGVASTALNLSFGRIIDIIAGVAVTIVVNVAGHMVKKLPIGPICKWALIAESWHLVIAASMKLLDHVMVGIVNFRDALTGETVDLLFDRVLQNQTCDANTPGCSSRAGPMLAQTMRIIQLMDDPENRPKFVRHFGDAGTQFNKRMEEMKTTAELTSFTLEQCFVSTLPSLRKNIIAKYGAPSVLAHGINPTDHVSQFMADSVLVDHESVRCTHFLENVAKYVDDFKASRGSKFNAALGMYSTPWTPERAEGALHNLIQSHHDSVGDMTSTVTHTIFTFLALFMLIAGFPRMFMTTDPSNE